MVTILELAELSAAAYGGPAPVGWEILLPSPNTSSGYYGIAYERVDSNGNPVLNPDGTTDIVIANRGTRPTSLADLLTDLKLVAGVKTPAQIDAANFAQQVVALAQKKFLNPTFIETGHSLGGNEAQAAVVALVKSGLSPNSISAVTFNAPGIGGYTYDPAITYNVTNFYDQGDAIHLAGGTHLGNQIMLPAGPNTSKLSLGVPAAITGGPIGLFGLLGIALWDVLGPAHSINTIIAYLQGTNPTLGSLPASLADTATAPSGVSGAPTLSVNPDGSLTLTDVSSNSVTLSTTDNKTLYATYSAGSGSAVFQELAALGTISIPLAELNQVITPLTNSAIIYENITNNTNNTYDISFNTTATDLGSGDGFVVTANSSTSSDTAYNYVVPSGAQTVVETIDISGDVSKSSISVIMSGDVTQLTGGTFVAGSNNTWTDDNGDQYQFIPSDRGSDIGTLTVTQGLLGATGNQITINNFDLNQAQTKDGYLGIHFAQKLAIETGTLRSADTFNADNNNPTDATASIVEGTSQTLTILASAVSNLAQTITLAISGVDASMFRINTGADLLSFNGDSVQLTIPAGQDSVTVALFNTGDIKDSATLQLTASMTGSDTTTTITSNILDINYSPVTPDPFTDPKGLTAITGNPQTDSSSNYQYTEYEGDYLNDSIVTGAGPNVVLLGSGNNVVNDVNGGDAIGFGVASNDLVSIQTTNGQPTVIAYAGGGGNNVITLNNNTSVVNLGSGNNHIYGNTETDIPTAIYNADHTAASGTDGASISTQDGNNTIVGGNGNDFITVGTGGNLIIAGPGDDQIWAGVEQSGITIDPSANFGYSYEQIDVAPYTAPNNYEGNTLNLQDDGWNLIRSTSINYQGGAAVGLGNDTIFGGSGNSNIFLSNGDNYVDLGTGNSSVSGGMGQNTIFGGSGDVSVFGGGGNDYIDGESGNDNLIGFGGDNTIFGGSGNDTICAGADGSNYATTETGNNYVDGGSGNDFIYGAGGNDTLLGDTGNSSIYGGAGNEYIEGGSGNVSINGGAGNDTIYAGGAGNDTIFAGAGNATIYGGNGTDSITGGAGIDIISAGDGGTTAAPTQLYAGSGTSTLYGGAGVDQILGGSGSDTLIAGTGTSTLLGGSGTEVMYSVGNATLVAGTGTDTLYGGVDTDILQGSSGNTLFVAGSGNETIYGGTGSNTYQFNPGFGNVELANTSGADIFQFGSGISLANLTISAAIDSSNSNGLLIEIDSGGSLIIDNGLNGAISQFTFANGTTLSFAQLMAQANTAPTTVSGLTGDLIFSANSADSLTGGAGNDTIYGFNGFDTLTAGSGDQTIYGVSGNNLVTGGTGNDTLYSAGFDTMIGGTGDTTFVVQNSTDVIQAQATGSNTNTIVASTSYVLPTNVQNLTLTGAANLTGTGNDLANTLTANSGNDTLIAGSGIATLIGGAGNDTFVINNINDVVQAQLTGSNTNTIVSSVNTVAPSNVQNLQLTADNLVGTGSDMSGVLEADGSNDTLVSGTGITAMNGYGENETFLVNNSADVVLGSNSDTVLSSVDYSLANNAQNLRNLVLTGTANLTATGNNLGDVITSNDGNDTLIAGTGVDTFIINNAADQIQLQAYSPYYADTVQSTVSYTLTTQIYNFELLGSADLSAGTGNFSGITLTGNAGNDTLTATGTYDTLIAGSGIDTLIGAGAGNYTYLVNNTADVIQQSGNATGNVQSSVNYTLTGNLRSLALTGSDNLTATGNAQDNVITANSGIDTLIAGTGNSMFYGQVGDTYVFNSGFGQDTIQQNSGSVILDFSGAASASDLTVSLASNDGQPALMVSEGAQSSVTVIGDLNSAIGQVELAGGQSLTFSELMASAQIIDTTIAGSTGNLVFNGDAAASITASDGNDTIYAWGAGDTITAGIGNAKIYGNGSNDLLIGGTGQDSLYAATGNDTLLAGTGINSLYGGSGNDIYIMSQGGTTHIYPSSTVGTEGIYLPDGMSYSDFTPYRSGDDLIIQSNAQDSSAIISGYYASSAPAKNWFIADGTQDAPQFLSTWINSQTQTAQSYQAQADLLKQAASAKMQIELQQSGVTGYSMGAINSGPSYLNSSNQYFDVNTGNTYSIGHYTFDGVSTSNVTVSGGSLTLGSSETGSASIIDTLETIQYQVPTYNTVTRGGGTATVTGRLINAAVQYYIWPSTTNAIDLSSIHIDQNGVVTATEILPTIATQLQNGLRTITQTVNAYTADVERKLTLQNITGDGGNDVIQLSQPADGSSHTVFAGTVVTGDGNDFVSLGARTNTVDGNNQLGEDPLLNIAGNPSPNLVQLYPGAFIEAGAGNDTIIGTERNDTIVAGSGFDYMDGGTGSDTYYVSLQGVATDVIVDTGDPSEYAGEQPVYGGDFPLDTLVLPDGITLQNLKYRIYQDPAYPDSNILQLSYGHASVLVVYQDPVGNYDGTSSSASVGIDLFQFADGTVLTRDQLIAQATLLPNDFAPVIIVQNVNLTVGQTVAASSLFTAQDTPQNPVTWYKFSNQSDDGSYFTLNGIVQPVNTEFTIRADQLGTLQYTAGSNTGSDAISVSAFDGAIWTAQTTFTMGSDQTLTAPVTNSDPLTGVNTAKLIASYANDTVVAGSDNDTLVAGSTGDVLVGGTGQNTFDLGLGNGQTTIQDKVNIQYAQAYQDTIQFGTGVLFSSLTFTRQGNDLLIGYGTGGDSLLLTNFNISSFAANGPSFTFVDGSKMNAVFDGSGGYTFNIYDPQGNFIGNQWWHADGSHGADNSNDIPDQGPTVINSSITVGHNQNMDETTLVNNLITAGLVGDTETITSVTGNAVLNGTTVTYTSPTSGPDSFNYTVKDQLGDTATGTVNVTVDTGPTLTANITGTTSYSQSTVVGTVTPGVSGDTLVLVMATVPTEGSLSLLNGNVIYTAADTIPTGVTSDTFTYQIQDQYGNLSDTLTTNVQITSEETISDSGQTIAVVGYSYTDYNASTGEVSGTVATAGAGYSYTYDNTQNVGGVAGVTESKVSYTYTDGSTYATDTVNASGQTIAVAANEVATVTGDSNIISLAGGSTLTANGANDNITLQGSSNVMLNGSYDNFALHPAFGLDVINGFSSTDTFQVDQALFTDWANLLAATSQSGADTIITADANNQITLKNVMASSLNQSQFHFA